MTTESDGGPLRPIGRSAATEIAQQLRVLADPARLQLLAILIDHEDGEASAGELAANVALSPSTVSHHLGVLHRARMVEKERRGTEIFYRPSHDALARYARLVETGSPGPAQGLIRVDAVLGRVADQLAARFSGIFSPETVERYVVESYQLLAGRARITRYLPSLTSSFAAERLTALAQAQGIIVKGVPEVLFVCVQNSGRSQLAAAVLTSMAGQRAHVRTAGSAPARALNPELVTVLDEIGVPLGAEFPKPLTEDVVRAADYVITMGCGDACPVYPGRRYLDWAIDDPAGRPMDEIRRIRDDVVSRVEGLVAEVLPAGVSSGATRR